MASTTPLIFANPITNTFGIALGIVSIRTLALAAFSLVLVLVALYTLVAIYHWMRYGHRSPLAIPAISVHIFVSLALVGFALTGLP